jgi:DNA polymerase-3 subunit delta
LAYKEFYDDLKAEKLKPLYLFYGPESFLMDSMLAHAKNALIDPASEAFNYQVENADQLGAEEIVQKMETLPFLSERRLVIFKNAQFFVKKAPFTPEGEASLKACFENPPLSTVAIFLCSGNPDKRLKWMERIQKQGRSVSFDRLDEPEFKRWINQRLKKGSIETDDRTRQFLIDRLAYLEYRAEISLQEIDQHLEVLIALCTSGGRLTREAIEQVVPQNLEADSLKMVDAVFAQNLPKSLAMLESLRSQGESEIMMLGSLYKSLTQMHLIRMLSEMGYSEAAISKRLGMHAFRVRILLKHSRSYDLGLLSGYIREAAQMDHGMKMGRINALLAFEMLLTAISVRRPLRVPR